MKIEVGTKVGLLTVMKKENIPDANFWLCQCKCGHPVRATEFELENNKVGACCYCSCGGKNAKSE